MRFKMPHRIFSIAAIILIILGLAGFAPAQKAIGAKSGVVQYSAGETFLDGTPIQLEKDSHVQIENGQILSAQKGSVELILAPAAYLWLGENSALRMRQNKLSDIQMEITQGSALIEILETIKSFPINIHVVSSVIEIRKEGLYRLNSVPGELRVYSGDALKKNGNKQTRVKKGRMVLLDGKSAPERFDVKSVDALDQLAIRRSSEIAVWMNRSQIETAMRTTIRGLQQDEFQERMQMQRRLEELQRSASVEWNTDARQKAIQGRQNQQEMEKARNQGYDPTMIPQPSQ